MAKLISHSYVRKSKMVYFSATFAPDRNGMTIRDHCMEVQRVSGYDSAGYGGPKFIKVKTTFLPKAVVADVEWWCFSSCG